MNTLGQQTERKLQDMLLHATRETEYYQTLFPATEAGAAVPALSAFPLLFPQTVQREHSRFLCGRYQYYPDIEHLLLLRSFGYSGVPTEIYWDSRDESHSQAFLWNYRQERFGVTPDEKCCAFRPAEYAGNKILDYMPARLSPDKNVLSFPMLDLSQERMLAFADNILSFGPAWMILPASVALQLAETMAAAKLSPPPSLRYMELYGEMPDAQTNAIIQDAFHVQTSTIYATQAAGCVAASCAHGHLHIFHKNAWVEVLKDGKPVTGREGDICITSLQNTAMPLIRLKTGDRGILPDRPCPCGNPAPTLQLTRGHKCSFIKTPAGHKISPFILKSLAEYTNEEISRCLSSIRFRQSGPDCMDVIMRVKPAFSGWKKEASRLFLRYIQNSALRQMQWNFIFADLHDTDNIETDNQPFFESWEGAEQ